MRFWQNHAQQSVNKWPHFFVSRDHVAWPSFLEIHADFGIKTIVQFSAPFFT